MSVQRTQMRDQGSCNEIWRVSVDGPDLAALRQLVVDVMQGGASPDDGLQEIVTAFTARANGKPAMAVQTIAVKKWIDENKALYTQLARFRLQPAVEGCSTTAAICSMTTDSNGPASPDLYLNMVELLSQLSTQPNAASLTFYIYNKPQPHCAFFGLHKGALTFALNNQCQ